MYFHKDSELFLYLRDMKENVPVIYAAPLQGFTEVAWRNAHAQCLGGVDAYYTPFVRLEKGEIRNKDRRDVSPEENTVPRLVPQVIASEPEELKVLTDFLASQGYREIDVNMGCPFPLIVRRGKGAGILSSPEKVEALLETMKAFPEIRRFGEDEVRRPGCGGVEGARAVTQPFVCDAGDASSAHREAAVQGDGGPGGVPGVL